jgi:hypothetical protein
LNISNTTTYRDIVFVHSLILPLTKSGDGIVFTKNIMKFKNTKIWVVCFILSTITFYVTLNWSYLIIDKKKIIYKYIKRVFKNNNIYIILWYIYENTAAYYCYSSLLTHVLISPLIAIVILKTKHTYGEGEDFKYNIHIYIYIYTCCTLTKPVKLGSWLIPVKYIIIYIIQYTRVRYINIVADLKRQNLTNHNTYTSIFKVTTTR